MVVRTIVVLTGAGLVLSACATERVVQPAKAVAQVVAGMQADLSRFDTQVKTLQSIEASLTAGNDIERDLAAASTGQIRTAWQVSQATNTTEAFKLLQQSADLEVAALFASPAPAASAVSASLPLDKLATVSSTLNQLSKPSGAKTDLQFLIKFGNQVNDDLSAAKPATAAGAGQ
jgi:outer membrane lipoprotein-sorting protein